MYGHLNDSEEEGYLWLPPSGKKSKIVCGHPVVFKKSKITSGVSELKVTSSHPLACTFANIHTTFKCKHSLQRGLEHVLTHFKQLYPQTLILLNKLSNYLAPPPPEKITFLDYYHFQIL